MLAFKDVLSLVISRFFVFVTTLQKILFYFFILDKLLMFVISMYSYEYKYFAIQFTHETFGESIYFSGLSRHIALWKTMFFIEVFFQFF